MKKLKILALCAIATGTLLSCQKEEVTSSNENSSPEVTQEIDQEVLLALQKLYFNPQFVEKEIQYDLLGNKEEVYLIEGDVALTREQIFEMLKVDAEPLGDVEKGAKQYRTRNLVTQNSTIRVMGYTGSRVRDPAGGSADGLTPNMRTGLQRSINNYNAVTGFNLNFTVFFSDNPEDSRGADMVVFSKPARGAGGSAGFPSGGRPNKFIRINSPTENLSLDVNETVITHEMGHSIGFRHTDFFSRQSCGQNTNEGSAGVGAIRIPGTPSGFDSTSIMVSCFSRSSTGEFNNNDITALRALY